MSAELACEPRERDRLWHLVGEQVLRGTLRTFDQGAERRQAAGRQRLDGDGNDLSILGDEVVETSCEVGGGKL